MKEILRRIEETKQQEELRKSKVLRLRRQEEEAEVLKCQEQESAAKRHAEEFLRSSLDGLLRTVDIGSNVALYEAQEQLSEIAIRARQMGVLECGLADVTALEHRLSQPQRRTSCSPGGRE